MNEKPILFSGPMVRAILEGRKTQTRRSVKLPLFDGGPVYETRDGDLVDVITLCPYGGPGDRLWVRETWAPAALNGGEALVTYHADGDIPDPKKCVKAPLESQKDFERAWRFLNRGRWIPSIHMPRWASRITLEVVSVRVERLQSISEADAIAEGIDPKSVMVGHVPTATKMGVCRYGFANLWSDINGPESWDANPYVWVLNFKRVKP